MDSDTFTLVGIRTDDQRVSSIQGELKLLRGDSRTAAQFEIEVGSYIKFRLHIRRERCDEFHS